jgi:uncharacterized membrane protein
MFMMMMMLAISSTIVEMMFAANFSGWRQNAHKYKWFNMAVSVLISFILGIAFGAAGLIALGAAMISTVLSIPGYAFLHWNYDSAKAQTLGIPRTEHIKIVAKQKSEKGKELAGDLAKVAYGTGRVITAPIWISRKATTKYKAYKKAS